MLAALTIVLRSMPTESSINDVTQFWTFFDTPTPSSLFYYWGLCNVVTKFSTPSSHDRDVIYGSHPNGKGSQVVVSVGEGREKYHWIHRVVNPEIWLQ